MAATSDILKHRPHIGPDLYHDMCKLALKAIMRRRSQSAAQTQTAKPVSQSLRNGTTIDSLIDRCSRILTCEITTAASQY